MPEDQFEFSSLYYYEEDTAQHTVTSSTDMLGSLISTLTGGVGGYSGNEAADGNFISSLLNGRNYTGYFDAIKQSQTDPSRPMAYLNYMVFDRNMNLVQDQSGVIQVGSAKGSWDLIEKDVPLTIGQEGYILISLSNELNWDVFFDQVKVKVYKGQIKQEQHYYPYGLAIKAGQDVNTEPCQNKYQGKELQDELNVQLYDFHARQYDPQLGKFWGLDPLDQFPSGYTGMGNDPANMVDPTGMRAERTAMDPPDDIYRWSEAGQCYFVTSGGTWNELAYSVAFDEFGPGALYTSSFEMERQLQSREAIAIDAEVQRIMAGGGSGLLAQGFGKFRQFVTVNDIFIDMQMGAYGVALRNEIDNINPLSLLVRGSYGFATGENLYTGQSQSKTESATQFLAGMPIGAVAGAVERNVVSSTSRIFEVGAFSKIQGVEKGLDAHHVGQKAILEKLIPGYNRNTAPAILVPKQGHTLGKNGLSKATVGFTNARQVLARDIRELRRVYPNVPNSSLQKLIQLNKSMYGKYFCKIAYMNNEQLIDKFWKDAVSGLNQNILEDKDLWYSYVINLPIKQQVVYTLSILNQQVLNGGFHQYFFNGYGQFAYLTIEYLNLIKAFDTARLLEMATNEVNREGDEVDAFREKVFERQLIKIENHDEILGGFLDRLDSEYYSLDEDLEQLVSAFLRN